MKRAGLIPKHLLVGGLLGLLLLAGCASRTASQESTDASEAERARVVQFWKLYREATQRRLGGELEAAVELYRQALALDSLHENALYYLGNTYLELGRLEDAYRIWQRLATAHPRSNWAFMQLGRLQMCYPESPLFDLEASRASFERALALNKDSGLVLHLGEVALLEGRFEEAAALFDKVLAMNFRSVPAYVLKAYLAWQAGDRKTAAALLAQARPYARARTDAARLQLEEGNTRTGRALVSEEATTCPLLDFDETALADTTHVLDPDQFLRPLADRLERVLPGKSS